jgi:putative ABC transport system substrate-binding protein
MKPTNDGSFADIILLKAVSPRLRRVAMLWNKDDLGMTQRYDASAKAARELGVMVQPLGVREPDGFNEAFATMDRDPPGAILMVTDSLTGAMSPTATSRMADSRRD